MSDNSLVRRQLQNRRPQHPQSMGDYMDPLNYQTFRTHGGEPPGPLAYPTKPGDIVGEGVEAKLDELIRLLRSLPRSLSLEFRTKFPIQPRESVPFLATQAYVAVPAGATRTVASFALPERYAGFLTHVGTRVVPAGSSADIAWDVLIVRDKVHINYDKLVFEQDTLDTPLPFLFELTQSSTVNLQCTNNGLVPVDVGGLLQGWTEFLHSYKPYGAESASGIG